MYRLSYERQQQLKHYNRSLACSAHYNILHNILHTHTHRILLPHKDVLNMNQRPTYNYLEEVEKKNKHTVTKQISLHLATTAVYQINNHKKNNFRNHTESTTTLLPSYQH